MASKLTTLLNPSRTPTGAMLLAVLALVVPVAGCGGGGSGSGSDNGKSKTKTNGDKADKKKDQPAAGSQIKDLRVEVVNPNQAKITATLAKPTELTLQVRRFGKGGELTKVGKVPIGKKPAGAATINWDLKVEGKKLVPGRYRVVLRGSETGKSRPATLTVS